MTIKHSDNGDVVRLGTRDWIWLITIITSLSVGVLARIDYAERQVNEKIESMRSEWTREAPSPAMWTKDSIARIEKTLDAMNTRLTNLERNTR